MGFLTPVTRTKIFNEFTEDKRKEYFSVTKQKYLPHVDTLYYSVFLKGDSKEFLSVEIQNFVAILNEFKKQMQEQQEDFWYDYDNSLLYRRKVHAIYNHCIGLDNFFDIYVCGSLPNDYTPRISVQLRSIGLWSLGERESINHSFRFLNKILSDYNLEVDRTQENRIDFCYHTNSLQNPSKYFSDNIIANNIKSTFRIGSKAFTKFNRKFSVEYLSLGNRQSNNLFFRSYNKTREVVEKGYKGIFLEIWRSYGLISQYDYEVYSYAYQKQNYDAIPYGQIEFYLNHGNDPIIKNRFLLIKNDKNINIDTVKKLVNGILPEPTLIMNIEYQTMRKFYFNGSELIDTLPILQECDPCLLRLFQILDNRKIFLDYLTSKSVSFWSIYIDIDVKKLSEKEIYMDWWYRLRNTKLDKTVQLDYKRKYNNNNSIEMLIKRLKGNLASLSLYKGNIDTDINEDFSNLLNLFNDNDYVLSTND
ncbi:hypothetical protein GNF86_14875, partial [Clostridium perfringens]